MISTRITRCYIQQVISFLLEKFNDIKVNQILRSKKNIQYNVQKKNDKKTMIHGTLHRDLKMKQHEIDTKNPE